MTRTEYTNKLREAGFTVRPVWQGKTEDPEGPRFDLTCYDVHRRTPGGLPGDAVARIILREFPGGGLSVFFASPSVAVSDDLRTLRNLTVNRAAA